MEFLVTATVHIPSDMTAEQREGLTRAEAARGADLRKAGAIHRIWRVPGQRASLAIWRASDATELHDLLMSLPLAPWIDYTVTALAQHYLELEPSS
jgi:muconolactone D-isomerase